MNIKPTLNQGNFGWLRIAVLFSIPRKPSFGYSFNGLILLGQSTPETIEIFPLYKYGGFPVKIFPTKPIHWFLPRIHPVIWSAFLRGLESRCGKWAIEIANYPKWWTYQQTNWKDPPFSWVNSLFHWPCSIANYVSFSGGFSVLAQWNHHTFTANHRRWLRHQGGTRCKRYGSGVIKRWQVELRFRC